MRGREDRVEGILEGAELVGGSDREDLQGERGGGGGSRSKEVKARRTDKNALLR